MSLSTLDILCPDMDTKKREVLLKNEKQMASLTHAVTFAKITSSHNSATRNSVYSLISKMPSPPFLLEAIEIATTYILEGKIVTQPQLEGCLSYFKNIKNKNEINVAQLNDACGAGIAYTDDHINQIVDTVINMNIDEIKEFRYRFLTGRLLGAVRNDLPWENNGKIKATVDAKFEALLGPKTENDLNTANVPLPKKKVEASTMRAADSEKAKKLVEGGRSVSTAAGTANEADASVHLALKDQIAHSGTVLTRFPPEPNGYLHIGHAKAMWFDFGFAKQCGGSCILRYDDTNPTAEKLEFIEEIQSNCRWLGHEPSAITYSSDYFQQLYELGVQLIKNDKAYVCHQTKEQMANDRETHTDSPWRNRPIEESLKLFEDMRKGKVAEGAACLRMKIDMQSCNPCMWDPVAYRVKFAPHPHAGDKWVIYPTYDYTHCIVDSLEKISHSLCTLEFEVRRDSYFWLLDALGLYKPIVWEYSRLNIDYNVMSKRKLHKLVTTDLVKGWDDPRLLTLNGLRRRGYTPSSINKFCESIGVTRTYNVISQKLLDHCIRQELDNESKRRFVVIDPLKIILKNVNENQIFTESVSEHPKDVSMGTRNMILTNIIYIEKSDFHEEDHSDFFGLAPNKTIGLRYFGLIKCEAVNRDADNNIISLVCSYEPERTSKPKGNIHFVAKGYDNAPETIPLVGEVRLYENLFSVPDPAGRDDWLELINPKSEIIMKNAIYERAFANVRLEERFQFERCGFFVIDKDTTPQWIVSNRTVTLKESADKKKIEA